MRLVLLVFALAVVLPAQQEPCSASEELRSIFEADQGDRKAESIDWKQVSSRDEARRIRVAEILRASEGLCAEDLFHAAMVYQHGGAPEHFLVAHVLSSAAAMRGHQPSRWLSAAALDRYLGSVGQPQIFGTQFHRKEGEDWTQEPFDRDIVSESIRSLFNVPALEKQRSRLDRMNTSGQR